MLPAAAASRIALLVASPDGDATPERSSITRCATLFLFGILTLALHARAISGSISSPRTRLDGGVATTKRHDGHEDPRMEFTQKLGAAASAVALSIGGVAGAQDAVQWRVEDGGNGHWYQCVVRDDPMSNAIARDVAASRGAQLASLCGSEFDFVMTSTGALQPERWQQSDSSQWIGPWIGLELTVEGWKWVDGSSCQFDRWDAGLSQPDTLSAPGEPFAFLYAVGQGPAPFAHDVPGTMTTRSAIIEWSADCNNDGIVDYGQIRAGLLADIDGNGVPDCCTAGSCTLPPVQWSNSAGGNGHWYAGVAASEPISWSNARAAAEAIGGHLATISSAAEDDLVAALALLNTSVWPIADRYGPWLGGYQPSPSGDPFGNWAWVTGEPWSYVPTTAQFDNSSRPDGQHDDYLHYIDHLQIWNDVRNDGDTYYGIGVRGYLIEWSADCNSDGIVDFGQIRAGELEDANGNNVPDCCEGSPSCNCPADIARDGAVNGIDLAAVLNNWGSPGGTFNADINNDGLVDGADLAEVLNSWGPCP